MNGERRQNERDGDIAREYKRKERDFASTKTLHAAQLSLYQGGLSFYAGEVSDRAFSFSFRSLSFSFLFVAGFALYLASFRNVLDYYLSLTRGFQKQKPIRARGSCYTFLHSYLSSESHSSFFSTLIYNALFPSYPLVCSLFLFVTGILCFMIFS